MALTAIVTACGGGADPGQAGAAVGGSSSSPPGGTAIDASFEVGGRSLHLACTGSGRPTLVLESGEGGDAHSLDAVRSAYDAHQQVCAYDRAGTGTSDPSTTPRGADEVTGDLHGLLTAARVKGPVVLVGTSAGGLIAQAYAVTYPGDVAGVVAMNPVPAWQPWSAKALDAMTPSERADERSYYRGGNGEALDYVDLSDRATSGPPPGLPLSVLISTDEQCEEPGDVCHRTYPAYTAIMRALARRWPEGRFTQVSASHEIYQDDLPSVRAAIDAVLEQAS